MKLLHLGDLHLGRSLAEYDLIDDQRFILQQILAIIDREKTDAVLIAGDVFDKAVPGEKAVRLLDEFWGALAGRGIKTFVISGNHDSDERLHYGSGLFRTQGLYISAVYRGALACETVRDAYGDVNIWMLPFVKASQVRHFFPDEEIGSYDDAVRVILSHETIDRTKRNILIAHQFVAGRDDPALSGSESLATQSVGLVEKIGYDCFDAFDYVALGHIHGPQRVGRDTVRYCGSPLKYSLSEVHNDKSVPLITLGEKGALRTELIPLAPMRDLRHLRGPLETLLSPENISAPEDFIYATLTDEDVINDAMAIFRQVYPNTVRIDYDNSRTREIAQDEYMELAVQRSFEELIAEFYLMMYGTEISDAEMRVMKQAANDAGVIADETGGT